MSVWLSRRLVSLLLRRITVGSLLVVVGDERRVYGSGAPAATVWIDSPRTWRMLLRGSRGMAEAFAQGLWDSPDLVALIRLAARNAGGLDRLRLLSAYGFCLGTLPLAARASAPRPPYRRSPSHVPCKSRRPGSRRLYAGHRLARNAGTRQTHPEGHTRTPGFDAVSEFRRLNSARPPGDRPRAERFLERLPGPYLARSLPRLFPGRSPRQSSANAVPGRFDARPRRADAGGPDPPSLAQLRLYKGSSTRLLLQRS